MPSTQTLHDPTTLFPLTPHVPYIPPPTTLSTSAGTMRGSWLWLSTRRFSEVIEINAGLLLLGCAQLFFSLMNLGIKQLNSLDPPVPTVELILIRMALTWICSITYMYCMCVPDLFLGPKCVRWMLVQRGAFGFIAIFGLYYSLQYLSLSDGTVLQFLAPMFTAIAGAVFLHEAFTLSEACAGVVSLVGVVLIARPTFLFGSPNQEALIHLPDDNTVISHSVSVPVLEITSIQRITAVGVALIGALGIAGAYTTIRCMGKHVHMMHNLVAYSALCVIITTVTMIVMRIPVVIPMRWDWLMILFLSGIFGFVGQVLVTLGLQREKAGRGAIAIYGQIVFATVFERIFLHTAPSSWSIIGTVIIVGSALFVALTKQDDQQDTHRTVVSDDPAVEEGLLNDAQLDSTEDSHVRAEVSKVP